LIAVIASVSLCAGVAVAVGLTAHRAPAPESFVLPTTAGSYLGVYARGVPRTYSAVDNFAASTGVDPNVAVYYSGWGERFEAGFARQARDRGAVPLVQIDPVNIRLFAIADGSYDKYLATYAAAVRSFGSPVILSFGHEMNGWWYSWGHYHSSSAEFVAAWRHIVTLFRRHGARNVTWLWTVNIIHRDRGIANPAPWWPGSSYVTWIGIDGYYYEPTWTFASLFGPTISAVHMLARHPIPILISETGAKPVTDQSAKIVNLFSGIRSYGLLGFVWFDAKGWQLASPAAVATFRSEAKAHYVTQVTTALTARSQPDGLSAAEQPFSP
jgi:mannan endo-1,4-beta-mannosidase